MQTRKLRIVGIAFLGLLALLLQDHSQLVAAPPTPGVQGPFIGEPVPAFSFNGDVRRLPQRPVSAVTRLVQRPLRRAVPNAPVQPKQVPLGPVQQTQMGTRRAPTALQNFDGLPSTGWYPPDPNGDVGPNHYVQAVNDSIGIYNKTGTLLTSFSFDTLFSGVGGAGNPCGDGNNGGDVIALYDATSDRWIIADMGFALDTNQNPVPPYYECIGMSQTSDPTLGWNLYALPITDSPGTNNINGDYAKLGVWRDGIYMSADLYGPSGSPNARVWALNRDDMKTGAALRHPYFDITSSYYTLLPGNLRGTTPPPAGEPEFFASIDQPSTFHLWKFHVDWTTPANSTFTGPTDLNVGSFTMPCNAAAISNCVPQQGVTSSNYVDALGDRLMMQLQYRNFSGTESLWVNHTVAVNANIGTPTGVRWYEIRDPNGSPFVYQQGTYQPDSLYRWMGSLAVDKYGDMALGYSVSSAAMNPAIRYTGRWYSDPLGALQQEATLIQGTGSQTGNQNRWGDYSAMTIDPSDDCTFWYTNMYYSTNGGAWRTRIGSFQIYPWCATGPPAPNFFYRLPVILKNANL